MQQGGESNISHVVKLSEDVVPYTKVVLQADIYLQDIPELQSDETRSIRNNLSLIQRRRFIVTAEPSFKNNPASRAVIVTSKATKT